MTEDKNPQLTPVSEYGEFGLIKHLTEHFAPLNESSETGVGDDCAIIDPKGKNSGFYCCIEPFSGGSV